MILEAYSHKEKKMKKTDRANPGKMSLFYPDGRIVVKEIFKVPDIEELQSLVGGYVQRMKLSHEERVAYLYFDEDGYEKQLPFNQTFWNRTGVELVGPVLMFQNIRA
jgi:hypothetical protein